MWKIRLVYQYALSDPNALCHCKQDWSYPRSACPNWSYLRTGVFAFSNLLLYDARLELPQNCLPELELPQNRLFLVVSVCFRPLLFFLVVSSFPFIVITQKAKCVVIASMCPLALRSHPSAILLEKHPRTACLNWSYPRTGL